jgi:hypothetical protein
MREIIWTLWLRRYFPTRSLAPLAGTCLGITFGARLILVMIQSALPFIIHRGLVVLINISPKLSETHIGFGNRVADAWICPI